MVQELLSYAVKTHFTILYTRSESVIIYLLRPPKHNTLGNLPYWLAYSQSLAYRSLLSENNIFARTWIREPYVLNLISLTNLIKCYLLLYNYILVDKKTQS